MAKDAPSVAWQPIETAPKDGTTIRVRHDGGTYCSPIVVGRWDRGNWWCSEAFIDPDTRRIYMHPTHWVPIVPQPERVSPGDTPNTDAPQNRQDFFIEYNCNRCLHGQRACVRGDPRTCEWLQAKDTDAPQNTAEGEP